MLEFQSSKNEGKAKKKQARNHINQKPNESDGAAAKRPCAVSESLLPRCFEYDGGRRYIPRDLPEAIVFAGDGRKIAKWGRLLDKADVPSTMIVVVHGLTDTALPLHQYSPGLRGGAVRGTREVLRRGRSPMDGVAVWRGAGD